MTDDLKHQYGLHAKTKTRQIFFDAYLDKIREKGIELELVNLVSFIKIQPFFLIKT